MRLAVIDAAKSFVAVYSAPENEWNADSLEEYHAFTEALARLEGKDARVDD